MQMHLQGAFFVSGGCIILKTNIVNVLIINRLRGDNPAAFQKESFWVAKGFVLGCKRSPFGE